MVALVVTLAVGAGLVVVGFLGLLALRSWRAYRAAGEVVPGVASRAPRAWAGSHSPEARLHRRLRDVVTALRALPHTEATVSGERGVVEQHVLALDERLVAAAALPEAVRGESLVQLTAEVERLEAASAELVAQLAGAGVEPVEAFEELADALSYLEEATAEVEALERPTQADQIPEMPSSRDVDEIRREPPESE